jgi:hypothetical protein
VIAHCPGGRLARRVSLQKAGGILAVFAWFRGWGIAEMQWKWGLVNHWVGRGVPFNWADSLTSAVPRRAVERHAGSSLSQPPASGSAMPCDASRTSVVSCLICSSSARNASGVTHTGRKTRSAAKCSAGVALARAAGSSATTSMRRPLHRMAQAELLRADRAVEKGRIRQDI